MNPTATSPPKTTTTSHRTAHRCTLPAEPATSSTEPTKKKHPNKGSDPNIHSFIKPFSKLYSGYHQNGAVSSKKAPILNPKTQIEDKPISKSPNHYLSKSQIEPSFQDKPMSKLSYHKADYLPKPPNYLTNPQIETTFLAKPISISAIQGKPISKSSHPSRKTALEIEKDKLRASITGSLEKSFKPTHDYKTVSLSENKGELKKSAKKEIVSLSKSQDSGGLKSDVKRPSFSLGVTNGGRRRWFCNSQGAELADFFSCNGVKIVSVDMPQFMQIHAVDCARKTCDSLEKFTSKTLAFTLKKEFDGVYGPAWHCIVGSSFGSFVTHSVGGFMYFSIDHKIHILLFKTTVQKAPN